MPQQLVLGSRKHSCKEETGTVHAPPGGSSIHPQYLCPPMSVSEKGILRFLLKEVLDMSGSHSAILGGFVLSVLLHACLGASTKLKIDVIPSNPKAGNTVTLNVIGVEGTILFTSWYRGLSTSATDQILTHVNGKDIKGEKFFSDASCSQNGSLVIQNFQTSFNGEYTVQIQTNINLQDGQVTVNGVASVALSPLTILLGLLLYSSVSYL
ncbi:cell adhesion molecule CEACAM16-like [Dendrobates tinctorius]|uniref:cell adhesion molecule CEACAM16-like n=1 Tax=Dendrobates tinctorius TaxID=92724 RepID=UPI003CCA54A6